MIHLTFTSCVFKWQTKEPGRVCRSRRTRRKPVKKEAILTRKRGKKHTADSRARNRGRGEPRTARETARTTLPGSGLYASYALSYALSAGFSAGYMRRGNILRERPQRRSSEPQPQRPRGRGRAEAAKKEADGRTCAWPRGARPKRPQRNMTHSPAGALADAGFLLFVHLPTRFSALHSYPKHKRKQCRRLCESKPAVPSLFRTRRHSETKVLLFPGTAGQGAGAGKKEQSKQCAG